MCGAYTSFQYNGKSLVDYFVVDERLVPHIPFFKVDPPSHLSDHALLSGTIELGAGLRLSNDDRVEPRNQPKRHNFIWENKSEQKCCEALMTKGVDKMMDTFLAPRDSVVNSDTRCESINDILQTSAKLSLKIRHCTPCHDMKRKKKDKVGFDSECRKMKNHVISLGKQVKRYQNDPVIYGNFLKKKKEFKKIVKLKYKEARNTILEKIMNMEKKCPEEFWKLLSKLRNKGKANDCPIPLNEWKEYFNNLHNKPLHKDPDEIFDANLKLKLEQLITQTKQTDPFNQPISIDEVEI